VKATDTSARRVSVSVLRPRRFCSWRRGRVRSPKTGMISPSRMRPPPPVLRTDPLGGLGEREKGGRTYEAPPPPICPTRLLPCDRMLSTRWPYSRPGRSARERSGCGANAAASASAWRRTSGPSGMETSFLCRLYPNLGMRQKAHTGVRPSLALSSLSPALPSPTPPCPFRLLGALRSTFRSLRRRYSRRWGWS